MEMILEEIERALKAELWYAAVAVALTVPDICACLEAAPNARRDGQKARYIAWCKRNLPAILGMTGDLCWDLRSGVLHEGRYKHRGFDRVVFTVPPNTTIHNVELVTPTGNILPLSVPVFCEQVLHSARVWYAANKNKVQVRQNLGRLAVLAPNGLAPYIRGPTTMG